MAMKLNRCLLIQIHFNALCANDDKRLIMEEGISTLVQGDHNVPAVIEYQEKHETDHYSGPL